MNASLFIARIFGLYMVIIASVMLARPGHMKRFIEEFSRNTGVLLLSGIFALFFGLAVILTHNVWAWNWTVLITIIGWIGLIKGIWLITFPDSVGKLSEFYAGAKIFPVVHLTIALLLGIYLTYMGFFGGRVF
ncbi:MAG: hypothetical protein PVH45_00500 [Candidatus Omnitrophota bacterium]|jgi:hypothetical protein